MSCKGVISFKDVFFIPVGCYANIDNDACYLAYSPFAKRIALIPKSSKAFQSITDLSVVPNSLSSLFQFDKNKLLSISPCAPDQLVRMSILPNEKCNFKCSYCYASKGRSSLELDDEIMDAAIVWFVSRNRCKGHDLFISILGGGEPLLSWNKTKRAILLIRECAMRERLNVALAITTNASLLTDEMANFLHQQKVLVNVSFEVLEDVQNSQRGYFREVETGIETLSKANVDIVFRSTITPLNVHRCLEMAKVCTLKYPFVKGLSMEVVAAGKEVFLTKEYLRKFLKTFRNSFFEAYRFGKEHNLKVSTSSFVNMTILSNRFCSGDFCLTPSGTISICHRISSPRENYYNNYIFGKVLNSTVTIDNTAFTRLSSIDNESRDRCKTCFMRWHCGGMCFGKEIAFPNDYLDVICDENCDLGLEYLIDVYTNKKSKSFADMILKSLE